MYRIWFNSMIIIIVIYFVIIAVVNLVIDPYGEYRLVNSSYSEKKFSTSYSTTPFVLYKKLSQKPYTLVFGTSRSQMISSKLAQRDILNFSSSLYGNPIDVFHFLRQLGPQQKKNIVEIWYLIDTHTMKNKISMYEKISLNSSKDFIVQTFLNFNIHKLKAAFSTVENNLNKNFKSYIDEDGANIQNENHIFNGIINSDIKLRMPSYNKDSLEYLNKIDVWRKENNINIKYFTPIYNIPYLQVAPLEEYVKQYRSFLNVIDGFYDFHFVEGISEHLEYFVDRDHVNTEGTRLLINQLKKESLDYIVTKENIEVKAKVILNKIYN